MKKLFLMRIALASALFLTYYNSAIAVKNINSTKKYSLAVPNETKFPATENSHLFSETIPEDLSKDIKVKKIWDQSGHNAFPDLLKFKGHYYCSFREGSSHIPGTNGVVRILRSSDTENWESIARIEKSEIDLHDPKLSITPNG